MDGNGNGQYITEHDRALAAAKLKDSPKTAVLRSSILAGTSDEHPLVQGAAFYRHHPDCLD